MFRKRLQFSKKGNLKFIGHLDFLRVFGEMISRSRLPVSYSAGFNPHILLSFALPLPLGFVSENDYVDLVFERDLPAEDISDGLNNVAPSGLTIKSVYEATDKCASVVAMADYSVNLCYVGARQDLPVKNNTTGKSCLTPTANLSAHDYIKNAIDSALSKEEIIIPKKTKSGIKNTDIRGDIFSVSFDVGEVFMRLSAGSARFLHPIVAAGAIFGSKPSPIGFTRLEMYKQNAAKL